MNTIQSQMVKLSHVQANSGQIDGLPSNPRVIRDEKFNRLKKSIEENPEMLALRELLLYPFNGKYVIIGGNMRFRAMKDLGYKEAPAKIIPESTPVEALRAYTIKDNAGFGEWDWDMLSNEWDDGELEDFGLDVWHDDHSADVFTPQADGGQTKAPQQPMQDYQPNVDINALQENLKKESFRDFVTDEGDYFGSTFLFPRKHKDALEEFYKKNGKDVIVEAILKFCGII